MLTYKNTKYRFSPVLLLLMGLFLATNTVSFAIDRISTSSGNFSQATTWSPAGVPSASDKITVMNNHVVTVDNQSTTGQITIANGGRLNFAASKKLTIQSGLYIYGILDATDGDIDLVTQGAPFTIGATGSMTWSPSNNTAAGATLFTNGTEYFHPASTLIIKKWYNYSGVPLGSVVTGNFGNLTLNTLTNGLLYEWNQNNQFEAHQVQGTLTIGQGWVVLDRSGTISNTTIGNIRLDNVNSYLDFHSGNHPGSFKVVTSSITNIGGKLNGIYNGEGNINLEVNGDITNLGNMVLIYNSGMQGIANGNASIKVTGNYFQSMGDFRGIFNISSTTSGKIDLDFNDVNLTGGIFMGQYACHTAGNNSNFHIRGDLTIDFSSPNSKFRCNGLTTLSGINNNLSLAFTIDGDFIIKGDATAEFTSSGSTGPETSVIKGLTRFEGCNSNFNYGNHSTTLSMLDNVMVSGGIACLSKTNGSLTVFLQKNLEIQDGNITVTAGSGNSNILINGNYYQTGGSLFLHNNNTTATPNIIYATVQGNFMNQSGNITFDNNASSTAQHILSLNGEMVTIGGNAVITTTVSPSNPSYGIIYYDRIGTMQYSENGSGGLFRYTKQVVNTDCELVLINGNMQIAESIRQETDMLHIEPNGILDAGDHKVYANNLNAFSSLYIDEDARIRISRPEGLYNGTSNASISAGGNMKFTLHEKSIVEYYGPAQQVVTGTGVGNANSANQQYGILEINKSTSSALLSSNQVTVRRGLNLEAGELTLNGFSITIKNGTPTGISTVNGAIKCEGNTSGNGSMVRWENIAAGVHAVPFCNMTGTKIPFYFTPVTGFGNTFAVSTRGTGADNRPLTNGVFHLTYNGHEAGNTKIIDRWFHVSAPGVKANISASYTGNENTTAHEEATKNFSFIQWNGVSWKLLGGAGNGVTTGTGMVTASAVNTWGPLLLVSNEKLEAADLLAFDAVLINEKVELEWTAMPFVAPDKYIVERSADDVQYTQVFEKNALPSSPAPVEYNGDDESPMPGVSYYRLKQVQTNGTIKYSQTVRIDNFRETFTSINNILVHPNPFSNSFTISYQLPTEGNVELRLTGSNGQIAFTENVKGVEGKNSFLFEEGNKLSPGIYVLTLTNNKTIKNYKLFHI